MRTFFFTLQTKLWICLENNLKEGEEAEKSRRARQVQLFLGNGVWQQMRVSGGGWMG